MESEIHVMPCTYSEVKKGQESVTPMNFVLESFSSTRSTISLLASLRTNIRRLN